MKNILRLLSIIVIIALLAALGMFVHQKYLTDLGNAQTRAVHETQKKVKDLPYEYVNIYFLYVKADGENVFTKIPRQLPQEKNKLSFAISELLKGPNATELSQKYYSEIPAETKLRSVIETDTKVIINLSSNFQYGGGSDSLYSRVQQLLKTVLANCPNKQVYLYLDDKQADVIGGEGLMIKQPLEEDSLFDE